MSKPVKIFFTTTVIICGIIFIASVIMVCTALTRPIYNIEHVDTLVIPESSKEDYKIYQKPFTNSKTSDIEIYDGYTLQPLSYSDMGYATPIFKYIDLEINGYCPNEEYQKIAYDISNKYGINYIQTLAIMYTERAGNNPYIEHINSNGTRDIGIMQVNTVNKDILKKITGSTDVEHLKNPEINIECASYLIYRNETYEPEVECLYDSLVVYNGGVSSLKNIKSGRYSLKCPASKYAAKVISIMNVLYSKYLEEV